MTTKCKYRIKTTYWESLPYRLISHALFISWHQCLTHPGQEKHNYCQCIARSFNIFQNLKGILPEIIDQNNAFQNQNRKKNYFKTECRISITCHQLLSFTPVIPSKSILLAYSITRGTHHCGCQDKYKPTLQMPKEEG